MLFHVSVEADDPQTVAEALAEIMGGEAFPFPPVGVGSWAALAGDQFGSLVEVYQRGTELHQAEGGVVGIEQAPRRHSATHFAMGTDLSREQVMEIAERHGWTAQYCRRSGRFGVIEVWMENTLLVEVLTKLMQREYLETITIENYRRMLDERPPVEALADAA